MKTFFSCLLIALALFAGVRQTAAQSSAFTYQGQLIDGAGLASGSYDLRFKLYDASSAGTQLGSLLTNSATPVSNGLFTVTLDFGNQFPGADRWLEIDVRTNGNSTFTTLSPRQAITPAPYAIYSANAGTALTAASANSVSAANVVGTIPLAQLPPGIVTNGASGVNITGTFIGNGAGVTNLNIALNSGGTIALSGGFALVSSPIVGNGPHCVIAADVNGDGKIDLISANYGAGGVGNTLSVLTNNGSGAFTLASSPVVGTGASSVTAADVNGDGKMDLVCANFGNGSGNTLSVLTNNGSGGFVLASSPVVGVGPYSVTTNDFNGDGLVDLVCANMGSGSGKTLSVLTNNGSGGFVLASSPVVGTRPESIVTADVNGDGRPDVISANFISGTLSVLTNSGGGNFVISSSPVAGASSSVTAADVNGDGKVDLICENLVGDALLVFTNNGSGGFAPYFSTTQLGVFSIVAADINGDGRLDLICANSGSAAGNSLSILTNNGTGFGLTLPQVVGNGPVSVVAADVNGDGKPDLICANSLTNTLSVLFNVPIVNGTFTGVVQGTGRITSPMWNAMTPINYSGGLTANGQFTTGGGTLIFSVSGSGYTTTDGSIGMNILLDGVAIDTCQIYANTVNAHTTFMPKTFVRKGVAAGFHTVSLQAFPGTLTDLDTFCVTILEFPF